ncbi:MAG: hypothetical protein AAFR00_13660 [Pseudomonadota bacterium]
MSASVISGDHTFAIALHGSVYPIPFGLNAHDRALPSRIVSAFNGEDIAALGAEGRGLLSYAEQIGRSTEGDQAINLARLLFDRVSEIAQRCKASAAALQPEGAA